MPLFSFCDSARYQAGTVLRINIFELYQNAHHDPFRISLKKTVSVHKFALGVIEFSYVSRSCVKRPHLLRKVFDLWTKCACIPSHRSTKRARDTSELFPSAKPFLDAVRMSESKLHPASASRVFLKNERS